MLQTFTDYLIRKIRLSGLTNTELAARLKVSRPTLYKLRNGEFTDLKISTLAKLSDVLGVELLELLEKYLEGAPQKSLYKSLFRDQSIATINHLTYPENSSVPANSIIKKKWEIVNTGKTIWNDLSLHPVCTQNTHGLINDNDLLEGQPVSAPIKIPTTHPGEKTIICVNIKTPKTSCRTCMYWVVISSKKGIMAGFPNISCLVNVVSIC